MCCFFRVATTVLVVLLPYSARGDDALLRQCFTSWWDYQNMQVTGHAWKAGDDEKIPFVINVGTANSGELPPNEVGKRIKNPGEPHIDSPHIIIEANAEVDGLTLQFFRELVTQPPPAARTSRMIISSQPVSDFWSELRRAMYTGVDGNIPSARWLDIDRIRQFTTIETLDEEVVLGQECKRLKTTTRSRSGAFAPISIEFLAAFAPTMQVIRFERVTGGPAGYADDALRILNFRKVKSLKVFSGKWLLCDRVEWKGHDGAQWELQIDDAILLPADHVGIWDYNRLTGVEFGGDAERATRKGSPRIQSRHSRKISIIPFTADEEQKIRDYLLAGVQPKRPRANFFHLVLLAGNFIAAVALFIFWKRRRAK